MIRLALLFLVLSAALLGCGKPDSGAGSSPEGGESSGASGNPLNAPTDYLGALGKAKSAAEGVAGTASLQQAIQQFATTEGRYPARLEELVEKEYIRAMPKAPNGGRFAYDSRSGRVSVAK